MPAQKDNSEPRRPGRPPPPRGPSPPRGGPGFDEGSVLQVKGGGGGFKVWRLKGRLKTEVEFD